MARKLKHPDRVRAEAELVSSHFGPVELNDNLLLIEQFNLPDGFSQAASRLLIPLPKAYPQYPPPDFYLDRGLRKNGKTPGHYYSEFEGKKYCRSGYAWYCLHIKQWHPNASSMVRGDNLLTAIEAVYDSLKYD